jgi:hypothetical protein
MENIKKENISPIKRRFSILDSLIAEMKKKYEEYETSDTSCPPSYLTKVVFELVNEKFKKARDAQFARLSNLNSAYKVADDTRKKAMTSKTGLKWIIDLEEIELQEERNPKEIVTINESGYTLKEGEISAIKEKQRVRRTLSFRKFRRFVPEVSAGVAFTDINFPKYGTTDVNGTQVVSSAGEDKLRRINFTSMLNWNYFTRNSQVNPFIQIGIGANPGYPAFLSGVGLRFNALPRVPPFAFSFGFASTWVKQLDKLHLDDPVSGISEVEKDTKYQFNWPPKTYVGFQFQF